MKNLDTATDDDLVRALAFANIDPQLVDAIQKRLTQGRRTTKDLRTALETEGVFRCVFAPDGSLIEGNAVYDALLSSEFEDLMRDDAPATKMRTRDYSELLRRIVTATPKNPVGDFDYVVEIYGEKHFLVGHFRVLFDDNGKMSAVELTGRDESEKRRSQQALKEQELRYRLISDAAADYAYSVEIGPDGEMELGWISDRFSTILGIDAKWTIGEHPQSEMRHIFEEDRRRAREVFADIFENPRPVAIEYRTRDHQGDIHYIEGQLIPQLDETGRIYRIYGLGRDVTERKIFERERQALLNDISLMAVTISHDVINEANMIHTQSHILFEQITPDEACHDAVQLIHDTTNTMITRLEHLMKLVQHQEESPLHERRTLLPTIIIGKALSRLQSMTDNLKAKIAFNALNMPAVRGNEHLLTEVWVNMISNALKFGARPPVLSFGYEIIDRDFLKMWVDDNGPGIPQENRRAVFDAHMRLHSNDTEGFGLGLALVRQIMTKLGGDYGIDDAPGGGTRTYIVLPLAQQA